MRFHRLAVILAGLVVAGMTSVAVAQDLGSILKRFKDRYSAGDYEAALVEAKRLEDAQLRAVPNPPESREPSPTRRYE